MATRQPRGLLSRVKDCHRDSPRWQPTLQVVSFRRSPRPSYHHIVATLKLYTDHQRELRILDRQLPTRFGLRSHNVVIIVRKGYFRSFNIILIEFRVFQSGSPRLGAGALDACFRMVSEHT